jgi:hypothetical protein
MHMTSAQEAKIATQRICNTIAHEKYPHEPSDLGFLPASIGYAASFSENWEMVVEQADLALYDVKTDGRNQICSAEEPEESEFWDLSLYKLTTEVTSYAKKNCLFLTTDSSYQLCEFTFGATSGRSLLRCRNEPPR